MSPGFEPCRGQSHAASVQKTRRNLSRAWTEDKDVHRNRDQLQEPRRPGQRAIDASAKVDRLRRHHDLHVAAKRNHRGTRKASTMAAARVGSTEPVRTKRLHRSRAQSDQPDVGTSCFAAPKCSTCRSSPAILIGTNCRAGFVPQPPSPAPAPSAAARRKEGHDLRPNARSPTTRAFSAGVQLRRRRPVITSIRR